MQQSEICCVCIRANLELISIMEADPNTVKYSCKLNECVPEVVWSEDSRICEQCIEQLEAACAFRDLCLQSYAIRRQLLERNVQAHDVTIQVEDVEIQVQEVKMQVEDLKMQVEDIKIPVQEVEDVKSEEITIDDEDLPIKVETDPDVVSELSSLQKIACNEPEFSNIKSYFTSPQDGTINKTNEMPNKSYLRDLLQTPQELLKVRNYTVNNNYSQYMKERVNEISNHSSLGDSLEIIDDFLSNDDDDDDDNDVLYVEPKETDFFLNTPHLQGVLQTTQSVIINDLHQVEHQYVEENTNGKPTNEENTNEKQTNEEKTNEKQTNEEKTNEKQKNEEKTNEKSDKIKAYNLHEDGIELVEENTSSSKSLLRDLLLKPHKTYTSQNENQCVETKTNNTFCNPLQTNPALFKCKDKHLHNKSYFDNHSKKLPDALRTEYYQCKDCPVKFKERRNLTKHNTNVDCIYCSKSFKTLPELKQHEKAHLNQKKYECSICHRSYNTTSILAKHKIIKHKNSKEWRYLCPHCDQKYPSIGIAYRDQHIRRNHREYICFHCNTGFSSKLLLIAHIQYKHNSENVMKQCHICQSTYINQVELESHVLQKHNLETIKFPKKTKKYNCDLCLKKYTTLKAKNSHYDTCDGIRRYTPKKIKMLI